MEWKFLLLTYANLCLDGVFIAMCRSLRKPSGRTQILHKYIAAKCKTSKVQNLRKVHMPAMKCARSTAHSYVDFIFSKSECERGKLRIQNYFVRNEYMRPRVTGKP